MRVIQSAFLAAIVASSTAGADRICHILPETSCTGTGGTVVVPFDPTTLEECLETCELVGSFSACGWSGETCTAETGVVHTIQSSDEDTCLPCSNKDVRDDRHITLNKDSSDTKVDLPNLNFGALNDWTMMMHVKIVDLPANDYGRIFDFATSAGPNGYANVMLYRKNNVMMFAIHKNPGSQLHREVLPNLPEDGSWVWVTISFNFAQSTYSVYYDLQLVSQFASFQLGDTDLDIAWIGRSHWVADPLTGIKINYFGLAQTAVTGADQVRVFMETHFTTLDQSNVVVSLDYSDMAGTYTQGGALLSCLGDQFAENGACHVCLTCGDNTVESQVCDWHNNRQCECEPGFYLDYNQEDSNQVKCVDYYQPNAISAGLVCGDYSVSFSHYYEQIGSRLHIDHPDSGVYRFKVRGSASGDGINIALVDKATVETTLAGVEVFIGGSVEPVIHVASSLGAEPSNFVDISATPAIIDGEYTNLYVKVDGNTVSVGKSTESRNENKDLQYDDSELFTHTFDSLPTINRAVFTFGYGDLQCEPLSE